jgi:hypothetical protein
MELSFRGRIDTVKEVRKRPLAERLLEVKDERATGEVLLDEALKLIKQDQESIGAWIDLMSGSYSFLIPVQQRQRHYFVCVCISIVCSVVNLICMYLKLFR